MESLLNVSCTVFLWILNQRNSSMINIEEISKINHSSFQNYSVNKFENYIDNSHLVLKSFVDSKFHMQKSTDFHY